MMDIKEICKKRYTELLIENKKLKKQIKELQKIVGKDTMTGLLNKHILTEIKSVSAGSVVVMMDLDNFKSANDNYGHIVGDKLIIKMAKLIDKHVYINDLTIRYGGDEYLIIFRNCSLEKAQEKIKLIIDNYQKSTYDMINQKFTASAGIYYVDKTTSLTKAIEYADKMLYQEKNKKLYLS